MFQLNSEELNETILIDFRTVYEKIRKTYLLIKNKYENFFNDEKGYLEDYTIMLDHVLDELSYDHKKVLLETIIEKKIKSKQLDQLEKYILNDFFVYNIIYKNKNTISIIKQKGSIIIGFFLQNTNNFFSNQNRQRTPTINDYNFHIYIWLT